MQADGRVVKNISLSNIDIIGTLREIFPVLNRASFSFAKKRKGSAILEPLPWSDTNPPTVNQLKTDCTNAATTQRRNLLIQMKAGAVEASDSRRNDLHSGDEHAEDDITTVATIHTGGSSNDNNSSSNFSSRCHTPATHSDSVPGMTSANYGSYGATAMDPIGIEASAGVTWEEAQMGEEFNELSAEDAAAVIQVLQDEADELPAVEVGNPGSERNPVYIDDSFSGSDHYGSSVEWVLDSESNSSLVVTSTFRLPGLFM